MQGKNSLKKYLAGINGTQLLLAQIFIPYIRMSYWKLSKGNLYLYLFFYLYLHDFTIYTYFSLMIILFHFPCYHRKKDLNTYHVNRSLAFYRKISHYECAHMTTHAHLCTNTPDFEGRCNCQSQCGDTALFLFSIQQFNLKLLFQILLFILQVLF